MAGLERQFCKLRVLQEKRINALLPGALGSPGGAGRLAPEILGMLALLRVRWDHMEAADGKTWDALADTFEYWLGFYDWPLQMKSPVNLLTRSRQGLPPDIQKRISQWEKELYPGMSEQELNAAALGSAGGHARAALRSHVQLRYGKDEILSEADAEHSRAFNRKMDSARLMTKYFNEGI